MKKLEFLALRDLVVLPGTVSTIYVGRPLSIATVESAFNSGKKIILSLQLNAMEEYPKPDSIYKIGVLANIAQIIRIPNNNLKIVIEVESRVKIDEIDLSGDIAYAKFEILKDTKYDKKELEALFRKILIKFESYSNSRGKFSSEISQNLKETKDFVKGLDIITNNLEVSSEKKQNILECSNIIERAYKILDILLDEVEISKLEKEIDEKVRNKINESQKNYYIKEKIATLKEELGDFSQDDDYLEIQERLDKANIPEKVRKKLEVEMKKMSKMPPFSAESSVTRNYIEAVLDLPWLEKTEDVLDLKLAQEILDRDHYGLKDAKTKVLDYLAVKKLNPSMHGSILCLSGPPGIGKTSLVKSIAESMGRKFVRVSLGGVRDEAEIRGHRRTYIGSMPGKIMKAMKEAGTSNPVILLDEIDKMSNDYKGDPASAMLEVLDPEQNKHFEDHYIDLEYDLSNVFFVATANDLRNVTAPLRDRMEILNLNSYTEFEKLNIAQNYLVKQAKQENGLDNISIKISDKVIFKIIDEYTREAGVRNLKREIVTLFRKLAREVVENNKNKFNLKISDLEKYLGKAKFRPEKTRKAITKIGEVNGLAWTSVGGVTLEVQGVDIPGKGEIALTGTLGNVMKESAQVAFTFVKANLKKYKPKSEDFFEKRNIHLHFPEGATPKDGPSAGITIATTIISVLCNKKVRQDVAMTGEITITGEVLAIGGVREKVIGAHRAGIKEVILPEDNRVDIDEIPDELKDSMTLYFAKTYDDVAKIIFKD